MIRGGSVSLTRWSAYLLLLFNQLIRFVNGDIRSFFFARADSRTIRRYAIISRPDIARIKDRKGKRLAINTLASLANFAIYQLLSRNGLDPAKMSRYYRSPAARDARFAVLIGGSVDATVVNSPFDCRAEQKGFEVLLSTKETVESSKSHQRAEHVAAKIDPESDEEVVHAAGAAQREFALANHHEISAG